MSKRFIGSRQTTIGARDRAVRDGGPQRRAGFDGSASGGGRYRLPFPGQQARPHHRRNSCRRPLRQESDAVHRARRRRAASRSARSSICWPPCAASASTTATSRSTRAKCRSWTAARLPSSRPSTRSAFASCRSRASSSRFSSRCASQDGDCWGELTPAFGLPPRRRDRLPDAADRPPAPCAGDELRRLPQRDLARPHLRLHARRGEPLEGRSGARRLARQHHRARPTTAS